MRNSSGLLIYVLLFGAVFYFLLLRPQQRSARAKQQLLGSLQLGDEVVTLGGLYGTIRRFDGDVLTLEIAPDVQVRVSRQAVSGRLANPSHDGDEDYDEDEDEDEEYEGEEYDEEEDDDEDGEEEDDDVVDAELAEDDDEAEAEAEAEGKGAGDGAGQDADAGRDRGDGGAGRRRDRA